MKAKRKDSDTAAADHRAHMKWWREARFGMFIHYGPFSQWGSERFRHVSEHRHAMSPKTYDRKFVEGLTPRKNCVRQWAETAKKAGMKYMVLTAKHHEGFCLWDSKLTAFNSVRLGPKYDMVGEYVEACRSCGLKAGLYYSLMDGHHADGRRCAYSEAARRRFLEFTRGLLRELLTGYGEISVLWYDGPSPLGFASEWESHEMNRMVRRLQPGIIINDRSLTSEDFTCPEGHISPPNDPDRDWEACMTFNGVWGYQPKPPQEYRTAREIVQMLNKVSAHSGNLLLNVGPAPSDGLISELEVQRLTTVGKWLRKYGQAVYGRLDRIDGLVTTSNEINASWSRRGNTAYLWLPDWPAGEVTIRKVKARVNDCFLMPDDKKLRFKQSDGTLKIKTPRCCPDAICNTGMLRLEFASWPR